MKIGVPKEIKPQEHRIGLTPNSVKILVSEGHEVIIENAIRDLKYGGIAINCWAGLIYGLCVTTWGAFPGNPPDNIQSGKGVVHNTYLFDHPQKSVVRGPFVIVPKPVWSAGHKNQDSLGKNLTHFEAKPSILNLTKVVCSALKA